MPALRMKNQDTNGPRKDCTDAGMLVSFTREATKGMLERFNDAPRMIEDEFMFSSHER